MAMVFNARGLDGAEKLLLLAYTNYTDPHGYCWPGHARIADDCGTSVATVKRVKKRLIEKQLLRTVRRVDDRTGEPITNLTRINLGLLKRMRRSDAAYDDNVMEQLGFDDADVQLPVKKKRKDPETPSDLLMAQDEPYLGSSCTLPRVNMSPTPVQDEPLSISDPAENHQSIRPSVPGACEEQQQGDGGTDGRTSTPPPAITRTEGTDFLQTFGLQHPAYTLSGKTLRDQALTIDGLLAAGWTQNALYATLISRPLPAAGEITTSPGAILAARLRDIVGSPVPAAVPLALDASPQTPVSRPTTSSADKSVAEGKALPQSGECVGQDGLCGRPIVHGHELCMHCLGYERCWECGTGCKHPDAEACDTCLDDIRDTLTAAGYGTPF